MKILITNDDGINANGIRYLTMELEKDYEVVVIAPNSQKSACSHSITLSDTLYANEEKLDNVMSKCYSLNGTPADCVKIGTEFIADDIDLVVSGINFGSNLGTDVLYSGTVSAAIEASIQKKPSIAISLNTKEDSEKYFEIAAKYARDIVKTSIENKLKDNMVLNVNIPAIEEIKGIKVCTLGSKIYNGCYNVIEGEGGEKGYTTCSAPRDEYIEDTDVFYIREGYITLTPLHYDLTNFQMIKEIDKWF